MGQDEVSAGQMSQLRLAPFTSAALAVVEPWFDDEQTRRWLGDR